MFPLGTSFLPGDPVVLNVFEDRYRQLISDVTTTDRLFGTVLIERGSEVGGDDKRFSHGVLVLVQTAEEIDGIIRVVGVATNIISIDTWLTDQPYPRAEFSIQASDEMATSERTSCAADLSVVAQNIRSLHERMRQAFQPVPIDQRKSSILASVAGGRWWDDNVSDPELWRTFWFLASLVPCTSLDRYELLHHGQLSERLTRLRRIIDHVVEIIDFRTM